MYAGGPRPHDRWKPDPNGHAPVKPPLSMDHLDGGRNFSHNKPSSSWTGSPQRPADSPASGTRLPSVHSLLNDSPGSPPPRPLSSYHFSTQAPSSTSISSSTTTAPPHISRHRSGSPIQCSLQHPTTPLPTGQGSLAFPPEPLSRFRSNGSGHDVPDRPLRIHPPQPTSFQPVQGRSPTASEPRRKAGLIPERTVVMPSHAPLSPPKAKAGRRGDSMSNGVSGPPRLLGKGEVKGEGQCYIYEDGSYCRTVVGGEPVNPSWGLTKAGKPRKRLAQACLTCREKKIKCEPGVPKCRQCTKAQRHCRGEINSSLNGTSPVDDLTPSQRNLSLKRTSSDMLREDAPPGHSSEWDGSPYRKRHPSAPEQEVTKAVNARPATSHYVPAVASSSTFVSPLANLPSENSVAKLGSDPITSAGLIAEQLAFGWDQDPYEADPTLTIKLLDLYYAHINSATYCIFSPPVFTAWVKEYNKKSPEDRMLLFSVLSLGSIFAKEPETIALGRQFAAIATHAAEKRFGKFGLQLAQTRLLLALYYFSRGKSGEAWDYGGAAIRSISAMNLNTEEGVRAVAEDVDHEYPMHSFMECARRTFWAGFLMDRYNGFCGGTLCVISTEDVFVRLPCLEKNYEECTPSSTPFYDYESLHQYNPTESNSIGPMGHLNLISAIWGDVFAMAARSAHRPQKHYAERWEKFYASTCQRLDAWMDQLPEDLRFTPENVAANLRSNHVGTFTSLHALYRVTSMRLNRSVNGKLISTDALLRSIKCARDHATQYLQMMQSLAGLARSKQIRLRGSTEFAFSTPFPGYTIMIACDVLSCGGSISDLPELLNLMSMSLGIIDDLAEFWSSAKAQKKAVCARLKLLADILLDEERKERRGKFWRLDHPMDTMPRELDSIYGTADDIFLRAI